MMNEKCNKLFSELWWLSDLKEPMEEFVQAMIEWVEDWNKGDIRICLIDLHELNNKFERNNLYIGYNDCTGATDTTIFTTGDFIEYIQEVYNEYAEDLCPEEYWVDKLNGILNNYQ